MVKKSKRKEVKRIKIKLSNTNFKKVKALTLVSVALVLGLFFVFRTVVGVSAEVLSGGFVSLSDSRPTQSGVTYTFDFDNISLSAIKCIQIKFNTEADGTGSVPSGLSTSGAVYNATSSDFVPDVETWAGDTSSNGIIKITNANGETPGSASNGTVVINGMTNGSTAGTGYFALLNTYNNINCSDSAVDNGVIAFIYTNGQAVSVSVDPSIAFTVNAVSTGQTANGAAATVTSTSTQIPLGTVTVSGNAIAAHDLIVNTNATGGYTIYTRYTGKPIYNAVEIDDHSGTYAEPSTMAAGTEAFGFTTEDTTYSQFQTNKYAAFTTSNAAIATNAGPVSNDTTRIAYQVGVAGDTPAGTYETTVVLTCTPTY